MGHSARVNRAKGVLPGALRLAVAGLVVEALLALRSEPPPKIEPPLASPAEVTVRDSGTRRVWSVRVDGWQIEIDGATAAIPRAAPAPEESGWEEGSSFVSPYDYLIGKHADAAGLDWRLVSAVIFEESRFRAESESGAGAFGLMQVRPIAARDVGETRFRDPDANIRTGVRYLKRLESMFAGARGRDRLGLVLAAYNMGPAHVQDAQALARRFGFDPLTWDASVAAMLPLLEEPQVYQHLPNGFAQGREVLAYVEQVLQRYDAHRRTLAAVPPSNAATALD